MAVHWRKDYLRYKRYFLNVVDFYNQRPDFKAFIELILSLSTISVLGVFAIRPTLLTVAQLYKKIEAKEQVLAEMDRKVEDLTQARSVYEQEKSRIELLKSAVPDEPEPDRYVRQVEGLIGKNSADYMGLSVNEVALLGTNQGEIIAAEGTALPTETRGLSNSISLENEYSVLKSFILDSERIRRPLFIEGIHFEPPLSEEELEKTIVTLVIRSLTPYIEIPGEEEVL
jgi:hypothetical protein